MLEARTPEQVLAKPLSEFSSLLSLLTSNWWQKPNSMAQYKVLSLTDFPLLERTTEVSSVALGGHILSCSDEWFAPASDLLKVEPAPSLKGQFGPKGALFSGWETRRHNPNGVDWVVLRLGPAGGASVVGFDIDTAHFNGNEAPEIEVFGLCDFADSVLPGVADQRVRSIGLSTQYKVLTWIFLFCF